MTEIVTDSSGRTTKINVPVKTTPNTLTGTTMLPLENNPRNDDENSDRFFWQTTKINVPVKTTPNTLTRTTMVMMTEIVTDSSGRTTKINVPVKVSTQLLLKAQPQK
ncbi:hypothetical protein TNCV_196081 [Trichonephila clavipes]|uniref:Uncharacterized protein n=1 Tax=Trichonephila clavipes TaxID=2585209 RepID=A0A8X7BLE2_TRICX|nr:hypothetical protein TNCV_196081 [Trichonephila clavipes]